MLESCHEYVAGPFLQALRDRCEQVIHGSNDWSVVVSHDDPNTIELGYPLAGVNPVGYVRPRILLELGTYAELIPSDRYTITSFAAEQFPHVFQKASCPLKAIKAERTFWEKATILHAEHHRPAEKPFPSNHARHYSDMAMLVRSPICEVAVGDLGLLRRVIEHKANFYYSAWARYDLAVPGSFSLQPSDSRLAELQRDYKGMSAMMFGDPPPLEGVLKTLTELEGRINLPSPG